MSIEALLTGILTQPGGPEIRVRRNKSGVYSIRTYVKNRTKTGHGEGATIEEAAKSLIDDMHTRKARA